MAASGPAPYLDAAQGIDIAPLPIGGTHDHRQEQVAFSIHTNCLTLEGTPDCGSNFLAVNPHQVGLLFNDDRAYDLGALAPVRAHGLGVGVRLHDVTGLVGEPAEHVAVRPDELRLDLALGSRAKLELVAIAQGVGEVLLDVGINLRDEPVHMARILHIHE